MFNSMKNYDENFNDFDSLEVNNQPQNNVFRNHNYSGYGTVDDNFGEFEEKQIQNFDDLRYGNYVQIERNHQTIAGYNDESIYGSYLNRSNNKQNSANIHQIENNQTNYGSYIKNKPKHQNINHFPQTAQSNLNSYSIDGHSKLHSIKNQDLSNEYGLYNSSNRHAHSINLNKNNDSQFNLYGLKQSFKNNNDDLFDQFDYNHKQALHANQIHARNEEFVSKDDSRKSQIDNRKDYGLFNITNDSLSGLVDKGRIVIPEFLSFLHIDQPQFQLILEAITKDKKFSFKYIKPSNDFKVLYFCDKHNHLIPLSIDRILEARDVLFSILEQEK